MNLRRRSFLRQAAAVSTGFFGLDRYLLAGAPVPKAGRYGPLRSDPHRILDLPKGFRYVVLSRQGDKMDDGLRVPAAPDGMAAFPGKNGRVVLVRNHELGLNPMGIEDYSVGPFKDDLSLPKDFDRSLCYDPGEKEGVPPFVGGTTTLVFHPGRERLERQFVSLVGTDRNCAGGPTPGGSWISCEEPGDMTSERGKRHGYCFEVPALPKLQITAPLPLKDMGRFRHEAIAVHEPSGIVYLTEDRNDGMIYRFLPNEPGKLSAGGKLQALKVRGQESASTRNWPDDKKTFPGRQLLAVDWMDLEEIESPNDDLRAKGVQAGAACFSRGEGMWYGSHDREGECAIYWCCTDGGAAQQGQIFRYLPSEAEGQPGEKDKPGFVELYLEPNDSALLQNGDNITIAPWGDLIICEDTKNTCCIRGVTPFGEFYTLGRNAVDGTEFAGSCFSPEGDWLFVNMQKAGLTLAITGPWHKTVA